MKRVLNKLKLRLPAILLLAAMFLFWPNYDPCKPVGPILMSHLKLTDAVGVEGDCSQADSVFTLSRVPGGPRASVRFRVPDFADVEMLRVRGRMQGEHIIPGQYAYYCGRIMLLRYDTTGYMHGTFDGAIYGSGSFGWSFCLNDYVLPDNHDYAEIMLAQHGVSGVARFDSLEVQPVKLRSATPWIKAGFYGAWLTIGLLYYHRCRLRTRRLRHLILLNILLILIGILLPGHVVQEALYRASCLFSQIEHSVFRPEPVVAAGINFQLFAHVEETVGRSFGHFLLFGSLAFLVLLSGDLEGKPAGYLFFVVFDVFLFGVITESLQYLTPDRTVDSADVLCNAYGILAAVMLFLCFKTFRRSFGRCPVLKIN